MSLKKTEENLKVSFPPDSSCFYEFGPFLLDPDRRLLWQDGELVELEPKAIDTLLVLVRAGGAIVQKEELVAQVWEGDAITDSSLFHSIYVLRKALAIGLNGKECIRNIPKKGYCFTAPVTCRLAEPLPAHVRNEPRTSLAQIKAELVTDHIRNTSTIGQSAAARMKPMLVSGRDNVSGRFRWLWGVGLGVAVLVLSCVLIAFRSGPAENISGDWDGIYSQAEIPLRFVLHISGSPGHFQATVDNPDQGELDSPVSGLVQSGDEVKFIIASDLARFAGKLEPGGAALDGTIFQGRGKMPVHLIRQPDSSARTKGKLTSSLRGRLQGTWSGTLIIPQQHLRVSLHINQNKDRVEASMDCPDQAMYGASLSTFYKQDREVRFAIAVYGVSFLGRLEENGSRIRGTLSQHGIDGELQLTRQVRRSRSTENQKSHGLANLGFSNHERHG
jgi:DNA-binding winged helix-turn-helix (wHTH) protein